MNQQDLDFLATYEGVWRNYLKDNTCKELGNNPSHLALMNQICIRNGIVPANLGCGNCIPKMFERLMRVYERVKEDKAYNDLILDKELFNELMDFNAQADLNAKKALEEYKDQKQEPIKIKIESKKRKK